MTDKNYNDIDLFDIKGFKTCEQVREEKLKEKVGELKMRNLTDEESEIIENRLEAEAIDVQFVNDNVKKQIEKEIEKYNSKIEDLTHEIDKLTSIRDTYSEIRNDLENLRMNIS